MGFTSEMKSTNARKKTSQTDCEPTARQAKCEFSLSFRPILNQLNKTYKLKGIKTKKNEREPSKIFMANYLMSCRQSMRA